VLPLLFHHDLLVAPLSSGSRGNCTYIGDARSGVLVDCGLGPAQTFARLAAIGLGDVRIEAVLVTHEHSDHVGSAAVLDRALAKRQGALVPFHVTEGTLHATLEKCRPQQTRRVIAGEAFAVGGFRIEPVAVPHDTLEPVCYTVDRQGARAAVITDLGRPTRLIAHQLSTLDLAVLEFNHDVDLLRDGPYPWALKQRIRSAHGHLSNEQAATLLMDGASARLRHLVLAHLSDENNRPELARDAAEAALRHTSARATVHIARQREPLEPLSVSPGAVPVTAPARLPPRPRSPAAEPAQPGLFPTP
jgi:phosphoribosyl 1,2-cyclic phosphodiesterase